MPELAGDPAHAAVERAVEDQPETDPGREPHVGQVLDAAPGAEQVLAHRARVGVVVELHRECEPPPELAGDVDARPALQDARRDGRARSAASIGAAQADPGAEHPFRRHVARGAARRAVSSAATSRTSRGRVGRSRWRRCAGGPRRREVADGGAHVAMAEVDPDRERRVRRERHLQRRPAEHRLEPSSGCCEIIPASSSSWTSAVTVARDSPSSSPSSARLIGGRCSRASTTRNRLWRSDIPPHVYRCAPRLASGKPLRSCKGGQGRSGSSCGSTRLLGARTKTSQIMSGLC